MIYPSDAEDAQQGEITSYPRGSSSRTNKGRGIFVSDTAVDGDDGDEEGRLEIWVDSDIKDRVALIKSLQAEGASISLAHDSPTTQLIILSPRSIPIFDAYCHPAWLRPYERKRYNLFRSKLVEREKDDPPVEQWTYKVLLKEEWVGRCLEAGRFLGEEDGWGGCRAGGPPLATVRLTPHTSDTFPRGKRKVDVEEGDDPPPHDSKRPRRASASTEVGSGSHTDASEAVPKSPEAIERDEQDAVGTDMELEEGDGSNRLQAGDDPLVTKLTDEASRVGDLEEPGTNPSPDREAKDRQEEATSKVHDRVAQQRANASPVDVRAGDGSSQVMPSAQALPLATEPHHEGTAQEVAKGVEGLVSSSEAGRSSESIKEKILKGESSKDPTADAISAPSIETMEERPPHLADGAAQSREDVPEMTQEAHPSADTAASPSSGSKVVSTEERKPAQGAGEISIELDEAHPHEKAMKEDEPVDVEEAAQEAHTARVPAGDANSDPGTVTAEEQDLEQADGDVSMDFHDASAPEEATVETQSGAAAPIDSEANQEVDQSGEGSHERDNDLNVEAKATVGIEPVCAPVDSAVVRGGGHDVDDEPDMEEVSIGDLATGHSVQAVDLANTGDSMSDPVDLDMPSWARVPKLAPSPASKAMRVKQEEAVPQAYPAGSSTATHRDGDRIFEGLTLWIDLSVPSRQKLIVGIKRAGGTIASDYSEATHVLIHKFSAPKWKAVVKSLATSEIWCLHSTWATQSIDAGVRKPEMDYLVPRARLIGASNPRPTRVKAEVSPHAATSASAHTSASSLSTEEIVRIFETEDPKLRMGLYGNVRQMAIALAEKYPSNTCDSWRALHRSWKRRLDRFKHLPPLVEVSQAGHPAVKKESSPTGQPVSQERRTPRGDVEAGAGDGPVPKSTPKRTAPSRVTAKVDSANTPQRKGESGTVPRSETLGDIPEQLDANVRPGTAVTARICHSYNNIREEEGRDPAEIGKVLHQKYPPYSEATWTNYFHDWKKGTGLFRNNPPEWDGQLLTGDPLPSHSPNRRETRALSAMSASPAPSSQSRAAASSGHSGGTAGKAKLVSHAKRGGGRMLYSEEEEREMAQFIHDCQVQGQIPTTALKFWEPFAATHRHRSAAAWAEHFRGFRTRLDGYVQDLANQAGPSRPAKASSVSSRDTSVSSTVLTGSSLPKKKESISIDDYNRLAEYLVTHVAEGDLPTSTDFGKFAQMNPSRSPKGWYAIWHKDKYREKLFPIIDRLRKERPRTTSPAAIGSGPKGKGPLAFTPMEEKEMADYIVQRVVIGREPQHADWVDFARTHPSRSDSAWTDHYRRNKSRINQLVESTRMVTISLRQSSPPSGSQANPTMVDDDGEEEEEEEEEEEIEDVIVVQRERPSPAIVVDDD